MYIPTLKKRTSLGKDEVYRQFFCSDLHIGSDTFNHREFKRKMDWARDMNARVAMIGDIGEFIVRQDMKRYSPSGIKSHIATVDPQLDAFFEEGADVLSPYADIIDIFTYGNHEASIIKYHGIDPLKNLAMRIFQRTGININIGGYRGAIFHKFDMSTKFSINHVTYYYHGAGGNAPVTKGMIDFNRLRNNYLADLFVTAHKHHKIADTGDPIVTWNSVGNPEMREVKAVQLGTFKGNIEAQSSNPTGFEDMHNFSPSGTGGAMIEFQRLPCNGRYRLETKIIL